MILLAGCAPKARPSVLHVGAHAAQGPRGLVRLTPTMFALLKLLEKLPPEHVARYEEIEAILWPGGCGQPFDSRAAVRWHVSQLNKVGLLIGYTQIAEVIDRVGVKYEPKLAHE